MSRPLKTGMDYFPHDTDACNDEKVELLRMLYGNDGYAFYFIMLERIYRTKCGELKIVSELETPQKEIVYDEETLIILTKKIDISIELFKKILKTCLKRKIFSQKIFDEKGVITSDGIKKRMKPVLAKRANMLKKYKNIKIVSEAETPQKPHRKPAEITPETDIEKERKGKERINNPEKNFSDDSNEIRLSKYLFKHMLKNNKKAKEPNYQKWAIDIDRMIRLDHRSVQEIKEIIKWCQDPEEDNFYYTIILSAANLRKHYDAMFLKKNKKNVIPKTKPEKASKLEFF